MANFLLSPLGKIPILTDTDIFVVVCYMLSLHSVLNEC